MNKLIKFAGAAALTVGLALPSLASASVTPNTMLVNGDVHGSAASGDVVNLAIQFTNTGLSTVQSVKVEIPGSGFPFECVDVLDENQIGAHTVNVNINTLGTTEGQWPVVVTPYGFNRVTTGSQPTDTDCTNSSGSAHTFNNQLKITNPVSTGDTANNTGNGGVNGNGNNSGGNGVNNGNSGNGSTGGSGNASSTNALLVQLIAQITLLNATLTQNPGGTHACAELAAYAGLGWGSGGIMHPGEVLQVKQLQQFLINNGYASVITYGPTGFFGNQTTEALLKYKQAHNCL